MVKKIKKVVKKVVKKAVKKVKKPYKKRASTLAREALDVKEQNKLLWESLGKKMKHKRRAELLGR